MAGSFSDFLENELLDHVFGGAAYTAPTTLYIALCTADPTDSGTGSSITEPSGNGYSRTSVTANSTNFPASSGGAIANGTVIDCGTASGGSWGTITHIAICDASSAGNVIAHADLDASKVIADGDSFEIAIGDLDITLA